MKTKILLLSMMLLSINAFTQTSYVEALKSHNYKTTLNDIEKSNDKTTISKKSKDVIIAEVDGSSFDEDYDKIYWIFITERIMNCVIKFKKDQTVESLNTKYGVGESTPGGYEWLLDDRIQILFNNSRPDEVIILFGTMRFNYNPDVKSSEDK